MRRIIASLAGVFVAGAILMAATDRGPAAPPPTFKALDERLMHAPHILAVATTEMLKEPHVVPLDDLRAFRPDIDRRAYLEHLVGRATSGALNDRERALLWTRWLQDYFAHPRKPPLSDNGMAIYDPLWLLMHRVAHCGQTNRLVVDGLEAIGIQGRMIQLRNHIAAEAWWDGAWHFLDGDLLDFGVHVIARDGTIPSAGDIVAQPELTARVAPLIEARYYPPHGRSATPSPVKPSKIMQHVFTPWRDPGTELTTPFVWIKEATREQERNVYYGWNHYRPEPYSDAPPD